MEITWEVEDGYIGKSRPQTTIVPDDELDELETGLEKEKLIEEYIQEDFANKISWNITNRK